MLGTLFMILLLILLGLIVSADMIMVYCGIIRDFTCGWDDEVLSKILFAIILLVVIIIIIVILAGLRII